MTKSTARQIAVSLLFSMESNRQSAEEAVRDFFEEEHYRSLAEEDPAFTEAPEDYHLAYIRRLVGLAEEHLGDIDAQIARYSDSWKVSRMTRTTLAILRCAVCEIRYMDEIPNSVAVNEAVELGKTFDSPKAAAYMNGILGSLLRGMEQGGKEQSGTEQGGMNQDAMKQTGMEQGGHDA